MSAPAADLALQELSGLPAAGPAPTMGRLKKLSYTHDALIDLIIERPDLTQNQLAAQFGYSPSWISNIMAADSFQVALARRREEIIDPVLKASIEERFKALVHQSLTVLMAKLEAPAVSDNVALKAAELGAKALGLGGHATPVPPAPSPDRLVRLAERLVDLQSNVRERTINGEVSRIEVERE